MLAGCSTSADSAHNIDPAAIPARQAAPAAIQLAAPSAPAPLQEVTQSGANGSEQSTAPLAPAPQPAFKPPCQPVTEAPKSALNCQPKAPTSCPPITEAPQSKIVCPPHQPPRLPRPTT